MAYKNKTGGRKVGTPNKFGKELKDMVMDALLEVGGKDYLVSQANDNANSFMGLLKTAMPLTIAGTMKHQFEPLIIKQSEESNA